MGPAHTLQGLTLPTTGWKLTEKLAKGATGGTFGVCYLAERPGAEGVQLAFIKALDFEGAFNSADPLGAFATLLSLAQYESEVAEFCTQKGMKNVVMSFGQERVLPPAANGDAMRSVFCIILERGEGDLRKKLTTVAAPSIAWKLAVVRDIAAGIAQLHNENLAHQDIKPSNVISMADQGKDPNSKLGDLGRAVRKSGGPYNALFWAGDPNYAPPERLYGYRPSDWRDEREAADAFMLGALIMFVFTSVPLLTALIDGLPDNLKPGVWGAGYNDIVKAALTQSQSKVIADVLRPQLAAFADEICAVVFELTQADPSVRGDRRGRRQQQVGIDRIWSRLRLLAEKARIRQV